MGRLIKILIVLLPTFLIAQEQQPDSLLRQDQILQGAERVNNLIRITRWYVVQNDTTGISYGKRAIALAAELENSELVGKAAFFTGVAYDEHQVDSAMKYYMWALEILESQEHPWTGYCFTNISRIYREKGWYPEALGLGLRSLNHFEKLGDSAQMAKEITNIGYCYDRTEDYRTALGYHKKALPMALEYCDDETIALVYTRIGIAYDELKMYDSAHYFNHIALDYYSAIQNPEWKALTLSNIGNTYIKQNRLDDAQQILEQALNENTFSFNQVIILINLANVYFKQGKYDASERILDKGILLAKETEQLKFLSEAYFMKSELYAERGNSSRSLEYFKLYNALSDSLLNSEKTQQLADLRIRYETEQKEKEILRQKAAKETLAKEKALTQLKVYNRNKWLIGISSLTLILLFFGLYRLQRTKRKSQAEKDAAIIQEREKGLEAVILAQENERKRIARDLHDGIGQQLSGLKLAWQHLLQDTKSRNPKEETQLRNLTGILDEAAKEVRNISHQMMPRVLSESGLIPAMEDMLSKSLGSSNIRYEFETYKIEGRFAEKIEVSLYRVTQELINNIIKHSGASMVNVQLFTNKQSLILIVEDNGKGMDAEETGDGHGMLNIKSRINSISGEVSYEPSPGTGTVATIRVPV